MASPIRVIRRDAATLISPAFSPTAWAALIAELCKACPESARRSPRFGEIDDEGDDGVVLGVVLDGSVPAGGALGSLGIVVPGTLEPGIPSLGAGVEGAGVVGAGTDEGESAGGVGVLGVLDGAGVDCAGGASEGAAFSSEHAAIRPSAAANTAMVSGLRRSCITSSIKVAMRRLSPTATGSDGPLLQISP